MWDLLACLLWPQCEIVRQAAEMAAGVGSVVILSKHVFNNLLSFETKQFFSSHFSQLCSIFFFLTSKTDENSLFFYVVPRVGRDQGRTTPAA